MRSPELENSVCLRPCTEEDRPFLLEVYYSVREPEVNLVPWSIEQKRAFVLSQFNAQDSFYRSQYPKTQFQIIELKGASVGRLYTDDRPETVHILDIALLPPFRRRGIGTFLLERILWQAQQQNKAATIFVESYNPAKKLYERLGFKPKECSGSMYELMEWRMEQAESGQ